MSPPHHRKALSSSTLAKLAGTNLIGPLERDIQVKVKVHLVTLLNVCLPFPSPLYRIIVWYPKETFYPACRVIESEPVKSNAIGATSAKNLFLAYQTSCMTWLCCEEEAVTSFTHCHMYDYSCLPKAGALICRAKQQRLGQELNLKGGISVVVVTPHWSKITPLPQPVTKINKTLRPRVRVGTAFVQLNACLVFAHACVCVCV